MNEGVTKAAPRTMVPGWIDWRLAVGCVAIAVVTWIAYAPVLQYGFIWDDDDYVTENQELRTWAGLANIWLSPRSTPQYYPLVHTTLWLEYQLWGLNPSGYHATNVVLHALSSMLLFVMLERWRWPGAWLAGALFALHPVHVESVAWVTERKNVLSGLWYLLAADAFVRFDETESASSTARWRWYAFSLICYLAALLSKTVTCTLPAALLVVDWLKHGRIRRGPVVWLLPFFALGIAGGLSTAWLERAQVGADGFEFAWSPAQRVLVAGRAVWFYAVTLLWPTPLVFFYPKWPTPTNEWWPYFYPVSALGLVGLLVLFVRRWGRAPLAAALFFGGTLFPALGFLNVYPMRYSYVADHFQYHASLGPLVLCAAALHVGWVTLLGERWGRFAGAIGMAGVVLMLMTLTGLLRERLPDFENERRLWERTLAKNPLSETAHHNLGVLDYKAGDFAAAERGMQRCVELTTCPEGQHGLALLRQREGKLAEALRHAERATGLIPSEQHLALAGELSFALKYFAEAERYLREVRTQRVLTHDESIRWAESLLHTGRAAEAMALLEQLKRTEGETPKVLYDLGIAQTAVGDAAAATQSFRRLIEVAPGEPAGYLRLGELYEEAQQPRLALQTYDEGAQRVPQSKALAENCRRLRGD